MNSQACSTYCLSDFISQHKNSVLALLYFSIEYHSKHLTMLGVLLDVFEDIEEKLQIAHSAACTVQGSGALLC